MTFEEYLTDKKIDSAAFRRREPQRWEEYRLVFEQVHPESFTTQKKFVINDLRRLYHLAETPPAAAPAGQPAQPARPVMRPAVKPVVAQTAENTEPPVENGTPETEAAKKPARPVMRPVVKKPAAEAETPAAPEPPPANTGEPPIPADTAPKKPARPVIRPVVKKREE
ncbi:MAG: hypothetical protein MUD08_11875 [Cytophagales bacterium]|jgi:hypothetical protein|nr:hypothetical protein [Cytophagales bacterium]